MEFQTFNATAFVQPAHLVNLIGQHPVPVACNDASSSSATSSSFAMSGGGLSRSRSNSFSEGSCPEAAGVPAAETFDNSKSDLPPLTFDDVVSPCGHNCWDNRRIKRRTVTLRCRTCQHIWRLTEPLRMACKDFHESGGYCALGSGCPYLHMIRWKSRGSEVNEAMMGPVDAPLRRVARQLLEQSGCDVRPSAIADKAKAMCRQCDHSAPTAVQHQQQEALLPLPTPLCTIAPSAPRNSIVLVRQPDQQLVSSGSQSPSTPTNQSMRKLSSSASSPLLPITRRYEPVLRARHEATNWE